jgi:hypothetical protein
MVIYILYEDNNDVTRLCSYLLINYEVTINKCSRYQIISFNTGYTNPSFIGNNPVVFFFCVITN